MSISQYDPVPLYRQLARLLRDQISSGELANLEMLRSEGQLAQAYGVGRDTVRRAIGVLRDEGLVFTVPQRGTFVGQPPE